jgi:hypothetical protein
MPLRGLKADNDRTGKFLGSVNVLDTPPAVADYKLAWNLGHTLPKSSGHIPA